MKQKRHRLRLILCRFPHIFPGMYHCLVLNKHDRKIVSKIKMHIFVLCSVSTAIGLVPFVIVRPLHPRVHSTYMALQRWNIFVWNEINMENQSAFFQFEISINVSVSYFRFIYKTFIFFSAGTVFRRQILTSKDGPALKGLKRLAKMFGIWLVEMVNSTNHMPNIRVNRF